MCVITYLTTWLCLHFFYTALCSSPSKNTAAIKAYFSEVVFFIFLMVLVIGVILIANIGYGNIDNFYIGASLLHSLSKNVNKHLCFSKTTLGKK